MEVRVLYITYDGLSDPLGQSQILPYLLGIAKQLNIEFYVLSFEKPDRYNKYKGEIGELCEKNNIIWFPTKFHSGVPVLSKIYDRLCMKAKAKKMHRQFHFKIVHCRSYISSEVGLQLKLSGAVKFIFDMRGFWPDEKKDGGAWDQSNPVFRYVYRFYKQKEKLYLKHADAIVSLTTAGKDEMSRWDAFNRNTPTYVIPCSADESYFTARQPGEKQNAKIQLGLNQMDFVLSYLGALGSWYMLDEMLDFFAALLKKYPNAKFLIVSHTSADYIVNAISQKQLDRNQFIIRQADKKNLREILVASDVNISFIKPVYSKISSSPTKLGEVLSIGIPVITNSGVGDVKEIVEKIGAGAVIDEFSTFAYHNAIAQIPHLLSISETTTSNKTSKYLGLQSALSTYCEMYKKLI